MNPKGLSPYRSSPEDNEHILESKEVNGYRICYHFFKPYGRFILKIMDQNKNLKIVVLDDDPSKAEEAFAKACGLAGKWRMDFSKLVDELYTYVINILEIEPMDPANPTGLQENLREYPLGKSKLKLIFNSHFGYVLWFPHDFKLQEKFGSYGEHSFDVGYSRIMAIYFFSEMIKIIEVITKTDPGDKTNTGNYFKSDLSPDQIQIITDGFHRLLHETRLEYKRMQ